MLVEWGFVHLTTGDGQEFSFRPSFERIETLGTPQEIVELYAALHGPRAAETAAYVLSCLCDQEDPTPLIGCWEDEFERTPGQLPTDHQVVIARHLMRHGICGTPSTEKKGDGKYSDKFDATEYVAAARVHLGLSHADAAALSMTEFQKLFEMKFPNKREGHRDVPTRAEYEARMAAHEERVNGNRSR